MKKKNHDKYFRLYLYFEKTNFMKYLKIPYSAGDFVAMFWAT